MNPSASMILKVMTLPGIGKKTAFKILTTLKHEIQTDEDLIDALSDHPVIMRGNLSKQSFHNAFEIAEKTLDRSEKAGIKVIGYFDSDYPILLKGIEDPALLLNAKGNYEKLNELPSVAIIGTRAPSDYGVKVGVRLGEVFGEAKFNVVSGLAIGCDTAGHIGCLNVGGFTTAVLAHGLDTIYPAVNKPLAARILDNCGLLISEYMVGQKGQPSYFVERDRIQAGLSQAVIVVETDIKGGTMHTVKFASNAKRIVAAFDHDSKYLYHSKTQGNQYLINNNTARPLSDAASIDSLKNTLIDLCSYILRKPVSFKPEQQIIISKDSDKAKSSNHNLGVLNGNKVTSKKAGKVEKGKAKSEVNDIPKIEKIVKSKKDKLEKGVALDHKKESNAKKKDKSSENSSKKTSKKVVNLEQLEVFPTSNNSTNNAKHNL